MLRGPAEAGLQVDQGAQIQILLRSPSEAGLQVDQGTQIQVLLRGPAEAGLQVDQGTQIQVLRRGPAEAGFYVGPRGPDTGTFLRGPLQPVSWCLNHVGPMFFVYESAKGYIQYVVQIVVTK
jgi:hypothetical protein